MNTRMLFALSAFLVVSPLVVPAADQKPAEDRKPATVNKRVDVEEYDKLRADKKNVIIDVRTPAEFKAGHIPGAINIDVRGADFDEMAAKLDKNKTYLVNCATGGRSATACKKLEGVGFKELYDLAPGFKGWEKAGKPVEK